MKIVNRVGVSFSIVATIVAGITMLILYTKAENNIKGLVTNHLKTAIHSRKHHIETLLEGYRETGEILAAGVVFKELLAIGKDVPGYRGRLRRVNLRLNEATEVFKKTFTASLLNKQGVIIASTNEALIGIDKKEDEVFLKAKEGPYIKDLYIYKTPPQLFAISIAARAFLDDEFLGVVVLEHSTKELFEITLDRTGLGKTGKAYLVNKDSYMITPSHFLRDSALTSKVDTLGVQEGLKRCREAGNEQHFHELNIYKDYRGVRVWGVYDCIPKMKWCLLAEIDEKEALAPLAEVKFVFFALLLIIPVVSWITSLFISKVICKPLYRLREGIKTIGEGNLDYKVGTSAKDEIGQLSRAFDKMTENLKKITGQLNDEITERKNIEVNLKEDQTYIRALWDYTRAGIIVIDEKTHEVVDVNLNASEMIGTGKEKIIGRECYNFLCPAGKGSCPITDLGRKVDNSERILLKANGQQVPILKTVTRITLKGRPCLLESFIDISKLKQAEKDLRELKDNLEIEVRNKSKALTDAQDKLIHSERLAAMGQLAGTIGHEFRNQLGVIRNAAYFLRLKMVNGDEKTDKHFSMLEDEIIAADRIIENILEFARTKNPVFKIIGLKNVLLESIKKVNISKKIEVTTVIDESLPEISADQIQLNRIFINIIINAVQAMEDGGKLTIKMVKTDKFVNILFKDTGCGIKEKDKKRIFEPFFSAKARGTGLGLSVAKMFAQAHGGGIDVESEAGKGTTVTIRLSIN